MNIEQSIKELNEKFNKISQKGYIKGIYNCSSSIGRTFEHELNLDRNPVNISSPNSLSL